MQQAIGLRMDYRVVRVMLGDRMLFSELAEFYAELESVSSRLKMMDIMAKMFSSIGVSEVSAAIYMTEGILLPPFEGVEFGVAEKLMEEAIAIGTGLLRSTKAMRNHHVAHPTSPRYTTYSLTMFTATALSASPSPATTPR